MNCKNCIFFIKGEFHHKGFIQDDLKEMGFCLSKKIRSDYVDDWLNRDDGSDVLTDGIVATGYEGRGELLVGENFGCIHFANKEPNDSIVGDCCQSKVIIDTQKQHSGKDELYANWFNCPNCSNKNVLYKDEYCSKCGGKFEWVGCSL